MDSSQVYLHWTNNEILWKNFQFLVYKKSFSFQWGNRIARRTVITMLCLNLRVVLSTPTFFPFPTKVEIKNLRSPLEQNSAQPNGELLILAWLVLFVIVLDQFQGSPQLTWTKFSYFIFPTWWFLSRNKTERFFFGVSNH